MSSGNSISKDQRKLNMRDGHRKDAMGQIRHGVMIAAFALAFGVQAKVNADTLRVPSGYTTIQAGIDAASDGDTVLVSDGTFVGAGNRDLDFRGKAILILSENGPDVTIIDCQRRGRGFYVHSGEDSTSVVKGFTITNGWARNGGAIYCLNSSPTITQNVFSDNLAYGICGKGGGGIRCEGDSSPTITYNTFSRNKTYGLGGGIHAYGSSVTISYNQFSGNAADDGGGGICCESPGTIDHNMFANNMGFRGGGGIYCFGVRSSPMIIGNVFSGNQAYVGHRIQGRGSGIWCGRRASPTVANSTFVNNSGGWIGGGIFCGNASLTILNSTLVGNSAHVGGGGISCSDRRPSLILRNVILWANTPYEISWFGSASGVTYCSIRGGHTGIMF